MNNIDTDKLTINENKILDIYYDADKKIEELIGGNDTFNEYIIHSVVQQSIIWVTDKKTIDTEMVAFKYNILSGGGFSVIDSAREVPQWTKDVKKELMTFFYEEAS